MPNRLEGLHWAFQRKFYSRPIRKGATTRIVACGMLAFAGFVLPYVLLYVRLWRGRANPTGGWGWLPLYSALAAGLFGALFSRLLYLQQNWDALTIGGLKDARDFISIFLRGCVGMTGAVIVSLALLVVWSFLAGFSERLVPSILKDTETSLGKTNKS